MTVATIKISVNVIIKISTTPIWMLQIKIDAVILENQIWKKI